MGGSGGHRIEVAEIFQTRAAAVVVAAHVDQRHLAYQLDDLVRTGAIAHHVAQIGNAVMLWSRVETGFQSLEIPVYVADQE